MVWPGDSVLRPEARVRSWLPVAPVIVKSVGLPFVLSIAHLMSLARPPGSGSLSVTLVATVVELVLLSVTVYPAV